MGNNFTPPPSETANQLQISNLLLIIYHDHVIEGLHTRPSLEVSPGNVHRIAMVKDAIRNLLRPCSNLSTYELIRFVWLIFALLVNRLKHGDASDLTQDQVPEQWMRTAFNDLLAVVRTYYSTPWQEAAQDIKKVLVERLATLAVYRSTCESTQKFEVFNNLMELMRNLVDAQAYMTLIKDRIGDETNASAFLYRDVSVYTSSLAAGTIPNTLEEGGNISQAQHYNGSFGARYETQINAVPNALNPPLKQAAAKLFGLLSHRLEDLGGKPANIVVTAGNRKMIRFTHLPSEVNELSDPIFDFIGYITIMVKSDLFTFRDSKSQSMLVVQYENASQPERGVYKHYLAQRDQRSNFSLANYKNIAIYVIGGNVNGKRSKSVLIFDLKVLKFAKSAKLNEARTRSSSTIASDTMYVFGGQGNGGYLDTIEALDVSSSSSKWETIRSENFTVRYNAVVCSLNEDHILICGGHDGSNRLNDVLVFDTKTKMTRKVAKVGTFFINNYNNQAYIESDGVVLALVQGGLEGMCLVRIGIDPNIFEIITKNL